MTEQNRVKAILIIDMPDSCLNCQLGQFSYLCGATLKNILSYVNERPLWCPLKPMPKRYVEDDFVIETPRDAEACIHGMIVGRNIVINEILGEIE